MTVDRALKNLDEAIAAAGALGLDVTPAERARDTMRARLGFPGNAYVLAIAGGTGVGKSSLLNAIAGSEVSTVGARRPTTSEVIAWVPSSRRHELTELLDWVGVSTVREHGGAALSDVAVLDIPDFDSIALKNKERVDALLPRVDAVAWVVDPEKYMDLVMHDAYLRQYAPRVRRQIVALNRTDLLSVEDAQRVADDMRERLRREGIGEMEVVQTRAREGAAGVTALREWLESAVDAKRVVVSRIEAEAREVVRGLAADAGADGGNAAPLVERSRRDRALSSVVRATLALIDIAGLERQAVAATRFAARQRGAGPLRHVTSAVYRLTGRDRVAADPARFLTRWRLRGSLAPAVEPLRQLVASTLPSVPAPLRPKLAALTVPASLDGKLADTIDRALTAEASAFRVPTSRIWSVIGAAQYLVTAALIFSLLWYAALFVVHDVPVGTIAVPYLGPVPSPVLLLAVSLLVGYILARFLQMHAGWLGRRWAKQVGRRVTAEVTQRVTDELLIPLDEFDASRAALAKAVQEA